MHGKKAWVTLAGVFVLFTVVVPLANAPDYAIALVGKLACYALVGVAMDLIWGFAGILSLGHGVFFALGGYAMGMYLMRSIGEQGVYRNRLPDFMVFLDWKELPWFWRGMDNFALALVVVLVVPASLAYAFGYFAFRSRIRGVYFSIITQALTFAMMLLFFRNDTGFGGNNGLTDFKAIYGYPLAARSTKVGLYILSVVFLFLGYLVCRFLVTSRLGRILRAIRDAESRLMFSGYDPRRYKLFVWTLSAVLCSVAGALYVPQVGIINPSEMQPSNSVEMAIWVAVGGRSTLLGAAVGAILVNAAKSWFTVAVPEAWLYVLGAIFIAVTLFLPKGIVGTLDRSSTLSS